MEPGRGWQERTRASAEAISSSLAQLAAQQRQLALGDQLQVMTGDLQRGGEAGRGRIELPQLQLDAFADRACPDARRVERLHALEHLGDLLGGGLDLGLERLGDFIQRLGDVAVVAYGIDDGARDGQVARCEAGELELPQQVLLQRLAARVGVLLLAFLVVAAAPGGLGRADAVLAPALVENLDAVLGAAFGALGLLGRGHDRLEGAGALGFLHGLEHHVRFEEFTDVSLQLEGG